MKKLLILTVALALVVLAAPRLEAGDIPLLTPGAVGGPVNGAFFLQGEIGSGTGVFPAFVRISTNASTESGYNTTVNNVYDNTSDDTHNYAIQLKNLSAVTYSTTGLQYYQFMLDINEVNDGINNFLSLDQLIVATSATANNSSAIGSADFTWRYQLDAGSNSTILLDFNLEAGSGYSDMTFLVPVSLFSGVSPDAYVYLFSQFGQKGCVGGTSQSGKCLGTDWGTSDGFEEWAYRTGPTTTIPDGGVTALMLGLSMFGLGIVRRFRR